MNKEEILKRAREENKGVDEVKRAIESKAAKISMAVGGAVCMLLNLMDVLFLHTDVVGDTCWIIYITMLSSYFWVGGIALKQKAFLFAASFGTLFAILLTVFLFIG